MRAVSLRFRAAIFRISDSAARSLLRLSPRPCRRGAFTLVELLTVVAIIGTLVGLLLPAVQVARESARQSACQNNLRQIGLALGNHESAKKVLPALVETTAGGASGGQTNTPSPSSFVMLLPWLEEADLYSKIATGTGKTGTTYSPFQPKPYDTGYPPWTTRLGIFLCPSDVAGALNWSGKLGPVAYAANRGDWYRAPKGGTDNTAPDFSGSKNASRGLFGANLKLKLADVPDGLSKTVAYAERRVYQGELSKVPDAIYNTNNTYPAAIKTPSSLSALAVGGFPTSLPNTTTPANSATCWACGQAVNHGVNLVLPPNGPSIDVGADSHWGTGLYTASSFHPGGVYVVMADGAVRFVGENVDVGTQSTVADWGIGINSKSPYGVWGAMGTRRGGETLGLSE